MIVIYCQEVIKNKEELEIDISEDEWREMNINAYKSTTSFFGVGYSWKIAIHFFIKPIQQAECDDTVTSNAGGAVGNVQCQTFSNSAKY